jgi:hypothetical protein
MIRKLLLVGLLASASAAFAQKEADFVRAGAPVAPVIRASENTAINYLGGEPAAFTAALDADDSTYNRVVTCASLSGVGTAAAFDTITITNAAAGVANFIITSSLVGGGACGNNNDTFFTLYNGSFNPAAPLTGCLAVNDDISGATNRCSSLAFSIPVGETRVLVIAGFNNAALATGQFAYQVNFTGTTPVELLDFEVD